MHLAQPDGMATKIMPRAQGDVELCYDLGEQNCGYYELKLNAEAGLIVDLFGVEYITQDGTVQHTGEYRNGMRYICREGENHFVSLMRRSQRYLFVTLRNQNSPVEIDCIRLIESTYPVSEIGRFTCSNPALDRIWEISAHTLKLCMEDTYTDCPLYDQTLWVGDARNEALFAFPVFGAWTLRASPSNGTRSCSARCRRSGRRSCPRGVFSGASRFGTTTSTRATPNLCAKSGRGS